MRQRNPNFQHGNFSRVVMKGFYREKRDGVVQGPFSRIAALMPHDNNILRIAAAGPCTCVPCPTRFIPFTHLHNPACPLADVFLDHWEAATEAVESAIKEDKR